MSTLSLHNSGRSGSCNPKSSTSNCEHHYKQRRKREQLHTWEDACSRYGLEILLERVYFKRKRRGGKLDSNKYLESKKKKSEHIQLSGLVSTKR